MRSRRSRKRRNIKMLQAVGTNRTRYCSMGTKPDLKSMNWMGDNKMLRWMLAVTAANKCHRLRLCLGDAKEVFEVMLMAQSQPTMIQLTAGFVIKVSRFQL